MNRRLHSPDPRSNAEAGSAYILTLLILMVLGIAGLAVSLVTQSEVALGGAERTIHRAFYAAESGIAVSTSRALVSANFASGTVDIQDGMANTITAFHRVDLSPFVPTVEAACNFCEINNVGTYSERSYRAINFAVTAQSTRVAGPSQSPLGEGTVAAMVEVQPWKSQPEAYMAINDPTELAKVKF